MAPDKTDIITTVGRRLRQARLERKLTQEQLGKMIGYSEETIANYERGRRHISLDDLNKIAQVLDKPLAFFITEPDTVQAAAFSLKELLARSIEEFLPVRAIPFFREPGRCLILPREFEGNAALRIEDDSLISSGIGPDSILVFSTHAPPEPGSLVIALRGGATLPRYLVEGSKGRYMLASHPTDKTGTPLENENEILGVVTWIVHKPYRVDKIARIRQFGKNQLRPKPDWEAAEGKSEYDSE